MESSSPTPLLIGTMIVSPEIVRVTKSLSLVKQSFKPFIHIAPRTRYDQFSLTPNWNPAITAGGLYHLTKSLQIYFLLWLELSATRLSIAGLEALKRIRRAGIESQSYPRPRNSGNEGDAFTFLSELHGRVAEKNPGSSDIAGGYCGLCLGGCFAKRFCLIVSIKQ